MQDNAITLEPQREVPLYVAVSDYVRHFYRLAQIDQRSCLGFLMTLYRKRLTSSFYAIKSSLQRRLDYLLTQRGSVLSDDDLFLDHSPSDYHYCIIIWSRYTTELLKVADALRLTR